VEFFLLFQKAHLELVINKRSFDSLHPFWVKSLKEQNVYCCIYHVELEELKVGFNCMKINSRLHHGFTCSCEEACQATYGFEEGCVAKHATFLGLTTMWESIFCQRDPLTKWHNKKCVMGECELCGVENLPICHVEEEGSSTGIVKWKLFSMEEIVIRSGEGKKIEICM
jgi:hypothetical protein